MLPADLVPRGTTRAEVVELGPTVPSDIVTRWRALALELEGTSYFQTPDWIVGWWRTVASRPLTSLALWPNPDGTLRAVVALSRMAYRLDRRLPFSVPVLANSGTGPGDADHCGPLVDPRACQDVAAWLSDAAARSTLLLCSADAASDLPRPEGSRLIATTKCPRLHIGDAAAPVGRSANFRRQLGRFERQLQHAGVTFAWQAPGEVDGATVDALLDLHAKRRDAVHGSSSLGDGHRALLEFLVSTATAGCGPAAAIARSGRRTVGVLLGFRWKETFSAYQSGWDPAYGASSLGSVLVHHAIRTVATDGVRTFDFLRGAEPYKYRFGAVDSFDHSYLLAHGFSGRAVELEQCLRHRVRDLRQSRASVRTSRRGAEPQ